MIGLSNKCGSKFVSISCLYQALYLGCFSALLILVVYPADAETARIKKVIHQYALTSANDFPQRDPQDWELLASNDGGKTWITLDVRTNELFQARQLRKLYEISNNTAFETYRLQIDKVRDPTAATALQLAEIELMGLSEDDRDPTPGLMDDISAQGDNPPAETVGNLFDGRVETKWLGWAANESSLTSWIQWQYGVPTDTVVTNISQLLALRMRAGDGIHVQIEGLVADVVSEDNRICLVDSTGFIELRGIDGTESVSAGQKVLITGISDWSGNRVSLKQARAQVLSQAPAAYPEHILLEQPLSPEENLKWVEIEGDVQYPHSTGNDLSFDVQNGASSMRVHLWSRNPPLALPRPGTRVSVRGICLGAFNQQGQWVAASLWAAGQDSLTTRDLPAKNRLPAGEPLETRQNPLNATTLMTIEQIRHLSRKELNARTHVHIRGVITDELNAFVQDDTAGIEVSFSVEQKRKLTGFGAYIDLDGWAALDDVGSPEILANDLVVLGRGELPQPQKLSLSQFSSGQIDAQWIEVNGVVCSTDGSHLLINCYGQQLMAAVAQAPVNQVNALVDAEVRVRGVGVTARDDQGRVQGIHLLIPSLEYLDITTPPANLTTLPVKKIGSLLGLNGPWESFHRVKLEGVVTLQQNQKVFLRDDTGSAMAILKEDVVLGGRFGHSRWLYWQTPQSDARSSSNVLFLPGERVQVVGFSETHRYSPVLTEAIMTRLGSQQALKPVTLTRTGLAEGGLDSSLVTFEGVLRGQTTIGPNIVLELEWLDRTLQVLLPNQASELFKIQPGSRLRITGVCQIDPPAYPELGLVAGPVRILTRSPDDLTVLSQPSWWTVQRALMLVGGMTFVILAGLVWIRELRRLVAERTIQLSKEIQLRERAESRHALEKERARIAKDLHDDLGANLTQIIFLSERVEVARHDGQETAQWFDLIPATAQQTIQSLDEIVWAVNPRHDTLESLANYLSQFAQQHLTLANVRCVLDVPAVLPAVPLSAEVRHNLLLTTREALQNVARHAAATEVRLTLKINESGLNIVIADNGRGFDTNSGNSDGNGLHNMQRRLQEIGGRLELNSRPGHGTSVLLFVPQKALHAHVIGGNENLRQDI